MKPCIKCQCVRPLTSFHKNKANLDGHTGTCKECRLAYEQRRYAANAERIRERLRQTYLEKTDEVKARVKRWYTANPAAKRAISVKRRAACLRALPPWADLDAIRAVYQRCSDLTQSTGVPHHVDHVVPLQSPIVSGLHVHYNLEVVPAVDNLAKGNKLMETAYV